MRLKSEYYNRPKCYEYLASFASGNNGSPSFVTCLSGTLACNPLVANRMLLVCRFAYRR